MAVERLTDYERQIWTCLVKEDIISEGYQPKIGDIAIQIFGSGEGEGTEYMWDGSQWQGPLPFVDGGGGGGEAHPYISKKVYTQAENWLSDTNGNVKHFSDTYFTDGNGLYWGSIDQSYSGTYGAKRFCACKSAGDIAAQHASEWQRKSGNWSQNFSTGASWYIEAGATIVVYFILYTDVPEE